MRLGFVLMAGVLLTACGADGEPETPTRASTVTLSNNGVSVATSVGFRRGPFNLSLGLGL